jgi:hypothetical protein
MDFETITSASNLKTFFDKCGEVFCGSNYTEEELYVFAASCLAEKPSNVFIFGMMIGAIQTINLWRHSDEYMHDELYDFEDIDEYKNVGCRKISFIRKFIDEKIEINEQLNVSSLELRENYFKWCHDQEESINHYDWQGILSKIKKEIPTKGWNGNKKMHLGIGIKHKGA